MENELEMIQTLFGYQSFGLIPFPFFPKLSATSCWYQYPRSFKLES